MADCEEVACANVQLAICLHCLRRLCSTHIVAHGTLLLKEGDDLSKQINELAEQLNVSLQQTRTARDEATNKLNIWRQNQIDKIDYKYAQQIQDIECKKDHLIEFEDELTQRLVKEAKEPLQYMQSQQSANSQNLQTIRQVIANITRDSTQLELCLKDSSRPSSSTSGVHTTVVDKRHTAQPQSTNLSLLTTTNQSTPIVSSVTVLHQPSSMQKNVTPSSAAVIPKSVSKAMAKRSRATTYTSQVGIKRPPTYSCKKLIKYFQNVTGSDDRYLEVYITQHLNKVEHVNNAMILLLSLLEAWHSTKLPTVYNDQVLSHHINSIKKYIIKSEQKLTVMAAIQVFVTCCDYPENKSTEMLTNLLQVFIDNQCITKETVFDWYENGTSYGYNGFEKAKLWAKLFVERLSTNTDD